VFKLKNIGSLSLLFILSACGGSPEKSEIKNIYGTSPSQMNTTLCNDSMETIYIAGADDLNQQMMITRGWEDVAPGTCKNLSTFLYKDANSVEQIGYFADFAVRFRDKPFEGVAGLRKIGKYLCIPKNKAVDAKGWSYQWDYASLAMGGDYSGRCPADGERVAAYKFTWTESSETVFSVRVQGRVGSSEPSTQLNEYGFPVNSLLDADLQRLLSEDAYQFFKDRGFADKDNPVYLARKELAKLPTTSLNQNQQQLMVALRAWCWAIIEFWRAAALLAEEQKKKELAGLDRISNGMPGLIRGIVGSAGCTGLSIAAGDASDFYEVVVGYDLCGEKLDWSDRTLSGLGLVVGSGVMWRGIAKAADAGSDIKQIADGMTRVSRQAERLGVTDPKNTKRVLEVLGECALKAASVRPSLFDRFNRIFNPLYIPEAYAGTCNVEQALRNAAERIGELGFKNADEMMEFVEQLRRIPNFKLKHLTFFLELARKDGFGTKTLAEVADFIKAAHTNILPDMRKVGNIVIDEDKFMLRALALSDDVGASGYLRLQEGLAAARYEAVSGKTLLNSIDNSWDFVIEGSLEKVSLKGPLLSNTGLVPDVKPSVRKKAVEGIGSRAKLELEKGKADLVLIDLYGLSDPEKSVVKDLLKDFITNKNLKVLE
jgi:hypothetical protein